MRVKTQNHRTQKKKNEKYRREKNEAQNDMISWGISPNDGFRENQWMANGLEMLLKWQHQTALSAKRLYLRLPPMWSVGLRQDDANEEGQNSNRMKIEKKKKERKNKTINKRSLQQIHSIAYPIELENNECMRAKCAGSHLTCKCQHVHILYQFYWSPDV